MCDALCILDYAEKWGEELGKQEDADKGALLKMDRECSKRASDNHIINSTFLLLCVTKMIKV